MSENELKALISVILPGHFSRNHSKCDLQEEAIRWLLANGLHLSHEFTLIELDDGSYAVVTIENRCDCCFDRSLIQRKK
ncbi:unnamed protein product [Thelazia callipaeda]|uniref:Prophage protein n=1 Tax=Thelazia callipaeda TaxID=103827 RepID=A0A0N5D6W0_THECL|nr:unnamed protein product [Thelazia callipaeda]